MVTAALAARVVEVITEVGGPADSGYRYGSGCIVRRRTVLTAAHVVADAVSVMVRGPDKIEYTATIDPRFVGDVNGPGPDLALVEITDPAFGADLPEIGLAAVNRDSPTGEPVERCHAVGYPWFGERRSRVTVRDTVDAIGVVPVLSKLAAGLLSVQVSVAPRELPPQETAMESSQWSGMSGAPVFASGHLLGVITEHAPREGASAITAVPLTALQADSAHKEWGPGVAEPAAWWSRLGVEGIGGLRRLPVLPAPRPEPAYRATLREFGETLHRRMPQLLGRDRELAEIAAFAAGSEGYRWLVGGAFTGKTALLYETVRVGLPDNVDVVCYFLSRRSSDASSDRFLAAVVPQLAYLCEVDPQVADRDHYRALWQQAADQAAQRGRHLLLVVDGLDEDLLPSGAPSVASLLPTFVGSHAHVLAASRPHPELPDDVPDEHPLHIPPVKLDPFKGGHKMAGLAKKELRDLTEGDDADLAVDVLGLLTAAAGGLSIRDLVALRSDGAGTPAAADTRHIRRLVEDRAARSLERVGPPGRERYQFAHGSLLEYAQTGEDRIAQDLQDPEYRQRIHRWAERWRDAGWPVPADTKGGTPQYLLDTYPSTLADAPERLAQLAGDTGWIDVAIACAGVDHVLADLREAAVLNSADAALAPILAAVTGQAHNLRPPQPVDQPGYTLRQLWMQAAELTESDLAEKIRSRLRSRSSLCLVPVWTTRRASWALSGELGRYDDLIRVVAALPDGRVVTGGGPVFHAGAGQVLVWEPASAGGAPVELGRPGGTVSAMAVLADGRVVSNGGHKLLMWDPDRPGTAPVDLGQPAGDSASAMGVLPDGRVVTGGTDLNVVSRSVTYGLILVWDPERPGTGPVELGRPFGAVCVLGVLGDGRIVTGGNDGRVLVWDPDRPEAAPVELGRQTGSVQALEVSPDGRVITGGYDGQLLKWDPDRPRRAPVELGHHGRLANTVRVLPDGRVVSGGNDGRVLLWDPDQPGTKPTELGRHDNQVHALGVLTDGRVVTTGEDRRVLMWDPDRPGTGSAERDRDDSQVRAVVMLADGRVVTGDDRRVLVWDSGQPGTGPVELGRHDGTLSELAVLADGRVVSTGSGGQVLFWDPDRPGTDPVELGRHDGPLYVLAVLSDGRLITTGGDGRVLVWDPGRPRAAPVELGHHYGSVFYAVVLSDGRMVTSGDERMLVWDPGRPGTDPVELSRPDGLVRTLRALADGRMVAAVDDRQLVSGMMGYGQILIWDPDRPRAKPVELARRENRVRLLVVLPDGRVVATEAGGRMLVWDPNRPGIDPAELGHQEGGVRAVAVLADGRVVTGGDDRRVLVWDPGAARPLADQLNCSVIALAVTPVAPANRNLAIVHEHSGLSLWSFME